MKLRWPATLLFSLICLFGSAASPIVEFISPSIVRVRWNPEAEPLDNATGVCIYDKKPSLSQSYSAGKNSWKSDKLRVELSENGALKFHRVEGKKTSEIFSTSDTPFRCDTIVRRKVVYDDASARSEQTANGMVTVKDEIRRDTLGIYRRFALDFLSDSDEALYGLGAHMEDYMDLSGKTLWLTQHNLKAFIPVLVSSKGYGLLFDAGSSMTFNSDPSSSGYYNRMTIEAANTLDFYFILGSDMQDVAKGYRYLTGNVSMMPRWMFGYVQSKERYVSSEDIISTVSEYRRRHVPLDVIVQDWNYWPQGWGYMKMDPKYYPDPAALADSVHALNAKIMVSIWPNPQYCPEEEDFRSRGFMLEHSVYDAFNPEANDLYWKYADEEFFSNGFDAWWCDSSEPLDGDWNQLPPPLNGKPYSRDDHQRRWQLNDDILSETLGAERACLYSLHHAKGIYEHQRAASDKKRVVNLTRSPYAGQQRYGTIVWNGDTYASWESFRSQIPAGLNFIAAGNPYWSFDAGCFFTGTDGRWFRKGEFPKGVADDAYKEFYVRMLQCAAFLPMMRSHGTDTPREIWNFGETGTPYYDAILNAIRLRYSFLPYTYSMAAMQHTGGYSMTRPLVFDFSSDPNVFDIKDQFLFGDLMVCPVVEPGVSSRSLYLPENAAGWYDFNSLKHFRGGEMVEAETSIASIPVFAKAGSIVLTTEPAQHSAIAASQPVDVRIFPGGNASFTFYDDAGDGYAFERGEAMEVPLQWNDKKKRLTIGNVVGNYPEAPNERTFNVRIGNQIKCVKYNGKKLTVTF